MANLPFKIDGEQGFVGLNSRQNPVILQPGVVQHAQNVRMDRGEISVRNGCRDMTVTGLITPSQKDFLTACEYTKSDGTQFIILVSTDGLYTYNTSTRITSSIVSYPTGRTISTSDPVDAFQAENKVYILRGYSRNTEVTVTGSPAVDRTGSTVTATFTNPHGYVTGDEMIIYVPGHQDLSGSYVVTVTSSTVLTYTTSTSGNKNHTTFTAIKAKAPLVYDGSSVSVVPQATATQYPYLQNGDSVCMPPADFGLYFQGRIVLCVSRDEIAASNYYEPNIFDVSLDQFKINLGDNDFITGFTPYQENSFLIFKRNSIYYAFLPPPAITTLAIDRGIDTSSSINTLTTQFGCLARRSIQVAGQNVFFLSDRGIYMLNTALDLKLVGDQLPLSDAISDQVSRINSVYASSSCGLFFNNRFYLSVPVDDSTTNNVTFVYSMLNKAWESIDTYPVQYRPRVLLTAIYQSKRQMFAICLNRFFLCEDAEIDLVADGTGTPVLGVGQLNQASCTFVEGAASTNIDGQIITRRYTFNALDQKRFSGFQLDCILDNQSQIEISAVSYNPDLETKLLTVNSNAPEEKSIRAKIAHRAYALDMKFQINSGRPTIRGLTVDGLIVGRNFVSSE